MKTNFALILLFLIGSFHSFGQSVQNRDRIKRPDHNNYFLCSVQNGLFRDLENPVVFQTESAGTIVFGSQEGVIITKIDNHNLTVRPSWKTEIRAITLFAIDSISRDTLLQKEFKLRNAPLPELYLGNVTDSMSIQLLPNALVSYGYNEYVPNACPRRVLSGSIIYGEYEFKFYGERVPREIVVELYKLKRAFGDPDITFQLTASVSCASCIGRLITRTFTLI